MRPSHLPRGAASPPRTRTAAAVFEFGGVLQAPQRVAPHAFEEVAERAERVAARAIEAVAAVDANLDEARAFERPELKRDGAEGDVGHGARDVAGAALPVPDEPQDLLATRRGQR